MLEQVVADELEVVDGRGVEEVVAVRVGRDGAQLRLVDVVRDADHEDPHVLQRDIKM